LLYKNIDKAEVLKIKIDNFIEALGIADPQLLNVSTLLEVYKEEVLHDENFEKSSIRVSFIVDRLMYTNIADWDINDMRIAQITTSYVKNIEEVNKLVKKTIEALNLHINDRPVCKFKLLLYLNVLSCFLKNTFLNGDIPKGSTELKEIKVLFKSYFNDILKICDSNKEEFKAYELTALIRIALIDRDSENATKNLEKLRKFNDKSLYDSMRKEVTKYSPHFGIDITQKQLSIMIGGNIRSIREKCGLSMPDFAHELNISDAHLSFIETGERNVPTHKLIQICNALDVSMEEILSGIEIKKKNK